MDKQIYLTQASSAAQFSSQVSDLLTRIAKQSSETCIDREAMQKAGVTIGDMMYMPCWRDLMLFASTPVTRHKWMAKKEELAGDGKSTHKMRPAGPRAFWEGTEGPLDQANFEQGSVLNPTVEIASLAEVITNSLGPYRQIVEPAFGLPADGIPTLSSRPSSPERGLILRQFLQYGIGPRGNFQQAFVNALEMKYVDVGQVDLSGATMRCTTFVNSNLRYWIFRGSSTQYSIFSNSDLRGGTWANADLEQSAFIRSALPEPFSFQDSKLKNAIFKDALVASKDWPNNVALLASDFDADSVSVRWDEKRQAYSITTNDAARIEMAQKEIQRNCPNLVDAEKL